jgi:hypothetical protein
MGHLTMPVIYQQNPIRILLGIRIDKVEQRRLSGTNPGPHLVLGRLTNPHQSSDGSDLASTLAADISSIH